jgi:hypothetical protein
MNTAMPAMLQESGKHAVSKEFCHYPEFPLMNFA